MPITRVLEAIEEIKKGNIVIMIDDEDRENEGDLVYAASFTTPEKVNFMASRAKGLICVALSTSIAKRVELTPMVANNNSQHETAFTVSVDAALCTTGISAFERDMTIKLLADSQSKSSDFVRPGHIFPLIAKDGGVLVRIGHTEGTVDLCKLAGLSEAGVICEIMKDNGEMARRDDLDIFAKEHNLKTVFISDIVEYRLKKERLLTQAEPKETTFFGINVCEKKFTDHLGRTHRVFIFGKVDICANVRFHNIKSDIEIFENIKKFNAMKTSIEYLNDNNGVLIFMDYGRNDLYEIKEYGIGAQILMDLGIKKIRLLSHSKQIEFAGLCGFGLEIDDVVEV